MRDQRSTIDLKRQKLKAKSPVFARSRMIPATDERTVDLRIGNLTIDLRTGKAHAPKPAAVSPALKPEEKPALSQALARSRGRKAYLSPKPLTLFEYLPAVSLRALAVVVLFSLVCSQVLNLSAFEAHVVNVTATIKNDIPDIDPEGGEFCDLEEVSVVLSSSLPGADIFYTLDGSDPACYSNGELYTGPFVLATSTTVKARSCHDGMQSAVASAFFDISREYCPAYCGDGNVDPGEQCDDGNNDPGDGCDAFCQAECYAEGATSSSAFSARLDDGTFVTGEASLSDDIYAYQQLNKTGYIYLHWIFSGLPSGIPLNEALLTLEHKESCTTSLTVEMLDAGDNWLEVCDPLESCSEATSTCDLLPYIATTDSARDVTFRLKYEIGACLNSAYLDQALLDLSYRQQEPCGVCGNAIVEQGEQCDDGNNAPGDGCSQSCTTECIADGIASNTPIFARLHDGTDVTAKVAASEDIRADQYVTAVRYVYFDWQFESLPFMLPVNSVLFSLELSGWGIDAALEWWDGMQWKPACTIPSTWEDTVQTCELLPLISTTYAARKINLRLVLRPDGGCHEFIDRASLAIDYSQNCGIGALLQPRSAPEPAFAGLEQVSGSTATLDDNSETMLDPPALSGPDEAGMESADPNGADWEEVQTSQDSENSFSGDTVAEVKTSLENDNSQGEDTSADGFKNELQQEQGNAQGDDPSAGTGLAEEAQDLPQEQPAASDNNPTEPGKDDYPSADLPASAETSISGLRSPRRIRSSDS